MAKPDKTLPSERADISTKSPDSSQFEWTPKRSDAAVYLASGLTQKETAEKCEITDRTIRDWLDYEAFAEEVDRLSLMVSISSRAERLRLAMRVIKQKTAGNIIETKADLLEWLKFAQSETGGANLNLLGLAARFAEDGKSPESTAQPSIASPMAGSGSPSGGDSEAVN